MYNIKSIIRIVVTIPFIAACEGVATEGESFHETIQIEAGFSSDTKALLNNVDLGINSQLMLYDILGDDGHTPHLNGLEATRTSTAWDIQGAPAGGYSWLHDGVLHDHHFFGWLIRDFNMVGYSGVFMNGSEPVVPTVTESNGVYTWSVGAVPMSFTYDQFDFCYSNIVTREVANPDYSKVNLGLTHLFTAFGIRFHNYDSAPVTIKSIKIFGLTNVKSASIEFDTNTGIVTPSYDGNYTQSRQDISKGLELLGGDIVVPPDGDIKNVITSSYVGSRPQNEEAFFLMWPHTADELSNCKLAVKLEGMSDYIVLSMKPSGAPDNYSWDTGTKHHIELAARGKKLDLKVSPLPWDQEQMNLDDTEGITCNSTFRVKFDEMSCTIDDTNKRIYFQGGRPIKFSFKLETPQNATWMVKMEGDIDAFEVDNAGVDGQKKNYGDGISTPTGSIDGNTAWVTIYPRNLDPDQDYQIKISIVVRTSTGRLLVNDEQVLGQYKDYTIVQQAS